MAPCLLARSSENACHEAGQHPRKADAQADKGGTLLDGFHFTILPAATVMLCASGHTLAAMCDRSRSGATRSRAQTLY
jgi:hypothetical protein